MIIKTEGEDVVLESRNKVRLPKYKAGEPLTIIIGQPKKVSGGFEQRIIREGKEQIIKVKRLSELKKEFGNYTIKI